MAAECNLTKRNIQLFGFDILGQGFYSMEIPEAQVKYSQTTGIVHVLEGNVNEDKLNEELRLVVDDKWNFQARRMTDTEFLVVFPDKGTLETFTRFADFDLSIYNLNVKISKSSIDPSTSSVLHTC